MDSGSEDDSWATIESSLLMDESRSICSTCSSSDDEDCSYKQESQSGPLGDCTNIPAAIKKPAFVREKTFTIKQKADNDLEESYMSEATEEHQDDSDCPCSSSSCSSGSDEEEEGQVEKWQVADTRTAFPFTATPVMHTGSAQTPLDFFYLLFNQDFVQFLADSINERGKVFAKDKKKVFTPTDVDEVYTLLATHFMMGFTMCIAENILQGHRPSLNIDFNTYIRKERYSLLFRLLMHRKIESESAADYRSWYEVAKPIADKFNSVMKALMVPGKDLNLDKDTILFFNQRNEFTLRVERVRLHLLADDNGIFQRALLVDPEKQMEVRGETIARTLMEDFLDSGRSLYCINMYYPSIMMAEDFLKFKTHVTGILKKNRPRNPKFLKQKPQVSKLPVRKFIRELPDKKSSKKDEKPKVPQKEILIQQAYNKQGVCVCKITRPDIKFNLLSTEFNAKPAVDKQWECEMLEEMVKHTKNSHRDRQLSKCGPSLQRKNNRHVAYLIQAMCVNSYLMFKVKTGRKMKFVKFLEEILYQMLPLEANCKDKENATGQTKKPAKRNRSRDAPDECPLI